jgi:ribosomal protein S18 acetylase RimI-like enzyme
MAVTMRQIAPDEVEAAVEIALAAWAPLHIWKREVMGDEMYARFNPDWRAEKAQQVRAACAPGAGMAMVADADGRIAGFVTCYVSEHGGWAEIGNNAVHPDFQGHGIGTAMYEEVFRRLRERGIKFVKVSTGGDPFHARARRAYEKAGFKVALPNVTYYRKL